MTLSAEHKLTYLEEANNFFIQTMSPESKKAWEKFKRNG